MKGAHISRDILKELLIFGLPFLLSGIFDRTIELADRRLIGFYLGDTATGIYVASYTVAVLMRLLVYSFNAGWQPYFLSKIDEKDGAEHLDRIYIKTGILLIAIWFVASLWLPELIKIPLMKDRYLLHPDYWDGIQIIPIIMAAYVMMGLYFLQLPVLYHQGKTALNALFIGIGAGINIILNIVFIPIWGLFGAAIATFVAYTVMICMIRLWSIIHTHYIQKNFKLEIVLAISLTLFVNIMVVESTPVLKGCITIIYIVIIYLIQPIKSLKKF
jgi:O-antigen/teichoic acid export membrane protein